MKTIFLISSLLVIMFSQKSLAQDSTKAQSTQLLNAYYQVKDNLVKSNPSATASSAKELVKVINEIDKETANENTRNILIKDAEAISLSRDIKLQREKFATLSNNLFELAKTVKLSTEPVYQQYCPMIKASWLSNDKAIKNPYYGSAMLTCGNIKTTL